MTAVDFFKEELEKELEFKAVEKFWYGLYQQAKEMEKEKIEKSFDDGIEEGIMRGSSEEYNLEYYKTPEQYYNETFKSE